MKRHRRGRKSWKSSSTRRRMKIQNIPIGFMQLGRIKLPIAAEKPGSRSDRKKESIMRLRSTAGVSAAWIRES